MISSTTPKAECLARWPTLRLRCRSVNGVFQVRSGSLFVASGHSAAEAWSKAVESLNHETLEMYRDAYSRAKAGTGRLAKRNESLLAGRQAAIHRGK